MCLRFQLCAFSSPRLLSSMCRSGRITIVLRFFFLGAMRNGLSYAPPISVFSHASFDSFDSSNASAIVVIFFKSRCAEPPLLQLMCLMRGKEDFVRSRFGTRSTSSKCGGFASSTAFGFASSQSSSTRSCV